MSKNCFLISRIHPGTNKDKEAVGYLGRVVSVTDDVVEYRDWVVNVWSAYSAPLITQVSPSAPTYASIANRHVQPGVFKTQGITSQDVSTKSATWPRSQSDVETLVTENRMTFEQAQQPLARHPSADCLYALAGGIQMKVNTNSVWTATSVRKLANSLAQDNIAKKKVVSETKTSISWGAPKYLSHPKPTLANSRETSCLSEVSSYSGVIKQSTTSLLKQTNSTKTSEVDFTSKSKTVSTSGPTSFKTSVVDSTSKMKSMSSSAPASTKTSIVDLTSKTIAVSVSGSATTVVDSISKSKTLHVSGLTSTKTSVVDSTSKPKPVSVSGPTSVGLQKKTDVLKISTSNNNVSCIERFKY